MTLRPDQYVYLYNGIVVAVRTHDHFHWIDLKSYATWVLTTPRLVVGWDEPRSVEPRSPRLPIPRPFCHLRPFR
jgi:hypothetical protein